MFCSLYTKLETIFFSVKNKFETMFLNAWKYSNSLGPVSTILQELVSLPPESNLMFFYTSSSLRCWRINLFYLWCHDTCLFSFDFVCDNCQSQHKSTKLLNKILNLFPITFSVVGSLNKYQIDDKWSAYCVIRKGSISLEILDSACVIAQKTKKKNPFFSNEVSLNYCVLQCAL